MGTIDRQDDARRTGDALDRVIDEAVEAALRAGPVDLRAQVLARLAAPADERPRPGLAVFRPALLPVVGALLMMAGVGLLWQHASQQLGQAGSRLASSKSAPARPAGTAPQRVAQLADAGPATRDVQMPARADREGSPAAKAPAWLESDSDAKVAGAGVLLADADVEEAAVLPGAPTGNLGDPISPMARLRPIAIQPLTTPPILEAPPVSTLAKPVSTLADEAFRDRQDPGKSGGK
jgi:hypothetical protein